MCACYVSMHVIAGVSYAMCDWHVHVSRCMRARVRSVPFSFPALGSRESPPEAISDMSMSLSFEVTVLSNVKANNIINNSKINHADTHVVPMYIGTMLLMCKPDDELWIPTSIGR